MKKEGVILALDYGEVNIGVAISDTDQKYALAHSVIPSEPEEYSLEEICRIIKGEHVERIVVGMPLTLAGEHGKQAEQTQYFINKLQRVAKVPVDIIDERFSSKEAKRFAEEKGTSIDEEAARLLLETWLMKKG